ncbi:MAG TPA: ABC transporter substrate-binding protein [Candidatus Limnocylindria bacterium]|nr:ABC transporter substrate-binding protein [Candidatus Limnocylindria bacterium]
MPARRPVLAAFAAIAAIAAIAAAVAGCGPLSRGIPPSVLPSGAPSGIPSGSSGPSVQAPATRLTVGLGYIPSVQFAPFYLAQNAGYYRGAGLEVTFENKIDPDLVTLVGQGSIDVGVADGTSVIPAVSQGIPIRYIATIYGTYPSIVFSKASSAIATAADLKGKRLGIPGKYGSSWIMLQALLKSANLTPDDLTVVEYPDFGQGVAVQQGAVDAATGFANNEPVVLELNSGPATVLHVDDVVALPGPGLISGVSTLDTKAAAVRAFVAATIQAMSEISADPSVGLKAAFETVPELASDEVGQAAILAATIKTWSRPGTSSSGPFGLIDRAGWEASLAYLTELRLVPNPVTVDDLIRTDLLPDRP